MAEPKPRISAKTRTAVAYMVDQGLSRSAAAEKAGISDNWLYQQLRRPEVLRLRNELRQVLRTGEGARSIKRIADLAESATSEAVRFDANKLLLATDPAEPIAPTQRNETAHRFPDGAPGLMIVFPPPVPAQLPPGRTIEGECRSVDGRGGLLPKPVPHPAMVKKNGDSGAQ